MKIRSNGFRILALLVALAFLGVAPVSAQKKKKGKQAPESGQPAREVVKVTGNQVENLHQAEYLFAEGEKLFIIEQYKKALVLFEESEKFNPKNPTTKYKIAETYQLLEQPNLGLPYIEKAIELDPQNKYFYLLQADLYKQGQNYEKVAEIFKKLIEKYPENEDYYFELASAYLALKNPKAALQLYDQAEKLIGLEEGLIHHKQQLYLSLGDSEAALREGQKLMDAYPNEPQHILQQVQLLLGLNRKPEAVTLLQSLLAKFPNDPEGKLMLGVVYHTQDKTAEGDALIKEAFERDDLEVYKKMEVLGQYYIEYLNGRNKATALYLAEKLVAVHPEAAVAHSAYADFLMAENKLKDAQASFLKSVELDGSNYDVWQKLLNVDWALSDFTGMIQHSDAALELFPNQAALYLLNGTALYMAKKYEDAADMLEQGLAYSLNAEQKNQFQAQLGDVYYQMEDYPRMDAAYDAVLKTDANNQHVLNNYSYYLSLRREKLDLAKQMCTRLMQLAPNNPNYMDTYGWVLYQSGDYAEARKFLEKAATGSNSGAVVEHYGDVLFRLGEKENALKQWKKAKELGGSEDETLLDRKIKEGALEE